MQRQTVEIAGLLTDHQFSELYAIACPAPGPNTMFVVLLGHFIAGVPGAAVATLAMRCLESCPSPMPVSRVVKRFSSRAPAHRDSGRPGTCDYWTCLMRARRSSCTAPVTTGAACHHGNDVCARLLDPAPAADRRSPWQRFWGSAASCDITMNAFGAARPCVRHGLEHKLTKSPRREG